MFHTVNDGRMLIYKPEKYYVACLLHDLERPKIEHEQLHHPTFCPQIVGQ